MLVHPVSPLRVLRGSRQEFLGWTPVSVKLRVPPRQSRGNSHFIRNSLKSCQRVRPSGPSSWHLSTQIGFGVSKENVDGQSNGIHLARRGTNVHARSTIPRKDQELAGIAHETQWRRAPTA